MFWSFNTFVILFCIGVDPFYCLLASLYIFIHKCYVRVSTTKRLNKTTSKCCCSNNS